MNNIVSTKSISSCRTNAVLDECGNTVNDPKYVGNLIKFCEYCWKLLKGRKYVVDVKNNVYLSESIKNYFVFTEISDSEIQNYIKTMNPNKSVRSDVPSIRF